MTSKGGAPVATRFRVRVLAAKLTKSFTAAKASPVIAPEQHRRRRLRRRRRADHA